MKNLQMIKNAIDELFLLFKNESYSVEINFRDRLNQDFHSLSFHTHHPDPKRHHSPTKC